MVRIHDKRATVYDSPLVPAAPDVPPGFDPPAPGDEPVPTSPAQLAIKLPASRESATAVARGNGRNMQGPPSVHVGCAGFHHPRGGGNQDELQVANIISLRAARAYQTWYSPLRISIEVNPRIPE